MNLLVTGGLGFIGGAFTNWLLRRLPGCRCIVLDKFTYASSLAAATAAAEVCIGDIADYALVRQLLQKHDINTVVNFAAETHVDRSIADYMPFVSTNVTGTCRLLHAVRDHLDRFGSRDHFKFLHVSTDEVYGTLGFEEERRFLETDRNEPNSPYAASKAAADQMIRAYSHTFQIPVAWVHPSNAYGPRQHPEKLIPRMVQLGYREQPLTVHGDGNNVREWTHVEDLCAAIWLTLQRAEFACPGQHVNIGSGCERSNLCVIEQIRDLLLRAGIMTTKVHVADRPGNDLRYALDCSTLRSFGWEPRVQFEYGLEGTVAWYLQEERGRR